jgi:catechol 2,3-dioxygenase-like lactoylglutathione lyase family enzyme
MPAQPDLSDRSRSILALRPFVPAKDFERSKQFYADLGFHVQPLGDGLADIGLGEHTFLLQAHYTEGWAQNFVMHMLVDDLDDWWAHIASLDLAGRYDVASPRAPKLEPWGLRVAYVFDPSGLLWHFAEDPQTQRPRIRLKSLVPMLQAADIAATRQWYEEVLGFRCVGMQDNEWCRLARDDIALMFMRNAHLGAPQATATQYIEIDHVMALWAAIKDRCKIEWGPETMPYGMLEFAIKDPNGYLLSFGERVVERPTSEDHDEDAEPSSADDSHSDMHLAAVRVFVDDLAAARRFYGDVLGLQVAWEGEAAIGFDLDRAGLIIEIVGEDADSEALALVGRFVGCSIAVDDIEETYAELKAKDVKFSGAPERQPWGGVLAHFEDPSGNVLTLLGH